MNLKETLSSTFEWEGSSGLALFFYFSCLFNNHGKMNFKTMCVLLRQQEGWDLSLLETILLVPSEASGLQRKRGPINYVSIWWTEIAVAHSWKAWWTGFQFKSSSCEWRKLFQEECIVFPLNTLSCASRLCKCTFHSKQKILFCYCSWQGGAEQKWRKKEETDGFFANLSVRHFLRVHFERWKRFILLETLHEQNWCHNTCETEISLD